MSDLRKHDRRHGRAARNVCLLAAALCVAVTAAAQAPGLAAARQRALQAYDAGQTQQALAQLQALSRSLPRDFAVQEALGLLLAEAGSTRDALPHLKAAATTQPQDAAARANYGSALFQDKQTAAAVQELSAAAGLDATNAQTQAALGRALFLDHRPAEAARSLALASQLQPDDRDVFYDWMLALDASHQDAAALQALRQTSAGQRTPALEGLWGDVAEHAGEYTEAVSHLKIAAQADPSEANLYALTVEFLRHWTWSAAEQIAEYGLKLYPQSQRLLLAKGVALFGNTQFSVAATLFASLLRSAPENAVYADLLGRSCAALGGGQSSDCQQLRGFAAAHPENARASLFAAISLLHAPDSNDHLAEAQELLQSSLTHDATNSETWYQMAVLQQQRSEWPGSVESLQRAIALRPAYAEAHYRLSRAYAHEGHKEQAMEELQRQRDFAAQEKQQSDAQLKEVTIFLTDAK